MTFILAVLSQAGGGDWAADFGEALAKARETEAVLCVVVADDTPASRETLKSLDDGIARPRVCKLIRVKVQPGSREAGVLDSRWAPTVHLFQVTPEPPPSAKDQACLKILRERRLSLSVRGVGPGIFALSLMQGREPQIVVDSSLASADKVIDLSKDNETLGEILRGAASSVGGDYAVMDGAVVLAAKEKLAELRLRRDLERMRAGRLEGLPELQEADVRAAELLKRRIDLDLRGADRLNDAAVRWNAALGEVLIAPSDAVARAFIRETYFQKCDSVAILEHLEAEPKFVWFQKGGKVILSDKPERVALSAPRLRRFFAESVECDESFLPDGAAKAIESLAARLAAESPEDRDKAVEALKERVRQSETSKTVLRRLLAGESDAEARARLIAILSVERGAQTQK